MKREVKVEGAVFTYFYLQALSWHALERAEASNEWSFDELVIAMVFSGFCLEAYCNHLGQEKIADWMARERRLSPRRKLEILLELIDYQPNFAERPFQTFREIFEFRNLMAHGKTEQLSEVLTEGFNFPKPDWLKECSLESAKRFVDDAKAIIEVLHSKAGYNDTPFVWASHTYTFQGRRQE